MAVLRERSHSGTDLPREFLKLCLGNSQVLGSVDGGKLLFKEGHSWRQRRNMPMDVRHGLHAAEAEDVKPFRRCDRCQNPTEAVNAPLDRKVFVFGVIQDDSGRVAPWGEDAVAVEPLPGWEEYDAEFVSVGHYFVRGSGGLFGQLADEAAPGCVVRLDSGRIGAGVDRPGLHVGHGTRDVIRRFGRVRW